MVRRKKRKIIIKTAEEVELIREACQLVCKVLTYVAGELRPGLSGDVIDKAAEEMIRDHGAVPGFKGLYDCPSTLLVSRNEQVVHGLPTKEQVFQDGDILSIDCGTYMNEFYGDAAYTFCVGDVAEETMTLCRKTKHALYLGIDQARAGRRVGDISYAIQRYCERENGYGVVRELVGHGVGRSLHEAPDVANFGRRGNGPRLQEGLVIAIEPMINLGRRAVATKSDGWTIVSRDGKPSAHYEHSVAITADGPADLMSDHRPIEAAILKNPNLKEVVFLDPEMEARYQPLVNV
ncbi:MAG: type I methionyl aminopeptidase [Bacteroidota bacterium]